MKLGNMYVKYRRLPRAQFLRTCVRTAMAGHRELPDDFEATSPDLRPRIWARAGFEQQRLREWLGDKGPRLAELPSEPIGEHLLACLAYDRPESVPSIAAEDLAGWG